MPIPYEALSQALALSCLLAACGWAVRALWAMPPRISLSQGAAVAVGLAFVLLWGLMLLNARLDAPFSPNLPGGIALAAWFLLFFGHAGRRSQPLGRHGWDIALAVALLLSLTLPSVFLAGCLFGPVCL